jgi:regulator of sigma E protease
MGTLFSFIVAISVLVAVHEWGHFAMARWCGVKVLRFSVGFGPKLASWTSKSSGTEYRIAALPFGGFVKMLDEREGTVDAQERNFAFNRQSVGRRSLIVAAGPVANLLLAVVLYASVNLAGVDQAQAIVGSPAPGSLAEHSGFSGGEKISHVAFDGDELQGIVSFDEFRWWLTRAALAHRDLQLVYTAPGGGRREVTLKLSRMDVTEADANLFRKIGFAGPWSAARLGDLTPTGAANKAGLRSGDLVVQLDKTPIRDAAQLRDLIRASGSAGTATPQTWLVQRAGASQSITVIPTVEREVDRSVGRVGAYIGEPPAMVLVRYGAVDSVRFALERTWEVSALTLRMMGQIVTGQASLKNLSGPITIADYAGKSAAMGLSEFAIFLALVSISLGVLNLLPLPVLDGGHLMYYLWEYATGRSVSDLWTQRLQAVGLAVLMTMMSVAVFNDISRLLG